MIPGLSYRKGARNSNFQAITADFEYSPVTKGEYMETFLPVAKPTPAEQITALEATAARLAEERDAAVEARDKANARADVHEAIANRLRGHLDEVRTELRRSHVTCRGLAEDKDQQAQELDQLRNENAELRNKADQRTRWPLHRGRIGNQL